jgi:hypothetical protein
MIVLVMALLLGPFVVFALVPVSAQHHLIRDTQPQPIYILDLATGNSIVTLLFCFLGRPFTQFISLIWSSGVFRNSVEYVQGRKIEASLGKRNHWTVERVISNLTERIEIACEG